MKKTTMIAMVLAMFVFTFCKNQQTEEKYQVNQITDANGYNYETVTNDPFNTRIYTLDNGLKVYLSVNEDEPRIQTSIAVRAGSSFDPKETTGLAHYLEHMMFKGSEKIATLDWEQEKVLLQKISDLYEEHKNTDDPEKKKEIYAEIDKVSNEAAKFAAANEYDKIMSSIGASGTNAYTSHEQTVYINNIPTNELDKWIQLESERFSQLVLRLFHTELETVYEEFNMGQDNDGRKAQYALMGGLFKEHPYGTQTTIGKAEHLKNPSMVNIHNYWNTYYVPNNMAICMSGDLDFEETIKMIDQHWGDKKPNENLPKLDLPKEEPIAAPIVKEVFGPNAEFMSIAYRLDGANSEDAKHATLLSMLLSNSQAGLIDINLVQKQKVLNAYSYSYSLKDYGMFIMGGRSRDGQTLEEVKDLLLEQLDKIKKGEFEDWLIEAIINDFKLSEMRQAESNYRTYSFVDAFVNEKNWIDEVKSIDELAKITKEEIVKFANEKFADNYVVVYKRTGKDESTVYVEKPTITPVDVNRIDESEYFTTFKAIESENISPVYVDFKQEIKEDKLAEGIKFSYIKNTTNERFNLIYIIDLGSRHDKKLALAVDYLDYLGTDKYTLEELNKEYFKHGLSMGVSTGADRSYVYISGLDKSYEKGIEMLEHLLSNAQADKDAYNDYVDGIIKKRADRKLNKSNILWDGLFSYAKYGEVSPTTDIISEEELRAIDPQELVELIKGIYSYEHHMFYYGPRELEQSKEVLAKLHTVEGELKEIPEETKYPELDIDENQVYFVDYDMVQTDVMLFTKDGAYDKELIPLAKVYNEFYGSGLSSIVFQEIRESKGLAYSSFSAYSVPSKVDKSNYIYSFVGTQPDKVDNALATMLDLLNEMPEAQKQFEGSKESIMKKIDSERIIKESIFWTNLNNLERGIDYDYRKDVYASVKDMSIDDIKTFFNEHIKGQKYAFLVVGNKKNLDMNILAKYGKVKELTLEEIFNY